MAADVVGGVGGMVATAAASRGGVDTDAAGATRARDVDEVGVLAVGAGAGMEGRAAVAACDDASMAAAGLFVTRPPGPKRVLPCSLGEVGRTCPSGRAGGRQSLFEFVGICGLCRPGKERGVEEETLR